MTDATVIIGATILGLSIAHSMRLSAHKKANAPAKALDDETPTWYDCVCCGNLCDGTYYISETIKVCEPCFKCMDRESE